PTVECAVFTHDSAGILADGLPYDRCQVGLVTDVSVLAELERFDVTDAEQVYRVLRTQVDVVLDCGAAVLNADDPALAGMIELCDGEVVLYGSAAHGEVLANHLRDGGQVVFPATAASCWPAVTTGSPCSSPPRSRAARGAALAGRA